ncbi:hypothetical protein B1R45_19555 [Pseudomonas azotoformans]|nr:hypothetical protein B1R45_19555 [Pseudomonas azotoformans]
MFFPAAHDCLFDSFSGYCRSRHAVQGYLYAHQTHCQHARCIVILCISQRLSDLQRVTNRAIVLYTGRRNSDLNSRNLASAQRKSRINPDT